MVFQEGVFAFPSLGQCVSNLGWRPLRFTVSRGCLLFPATAPGTTFLLCFTTSPVFFRFPPSRTVPRSSRIFRPGLRPGALAAASFFGAVPERRRFSSFLLSHLSRDRPLPLRTTSKRRITSQGSPAKACRFFLFLNLRSPTWMLFVGAWKIVFLSCHGLQMKKAERPSPFFVEAVICNNCFFSSFSPDRRQRKRQTSFPQSKVNGRNKCKLFFFS